MLPKVVWARPSSAAAMKKIVNAPAATLRGKAVKRLNPVIEHLLMETAYCGLQLGVSRDKGDRLIGAGPRPSCLFGRVLVQDVDIHLRLHDVLYPIHI